MCPDCTAPEEWRDVVEFEGLYEVSTHGRIRNARSLRVLKPRATRQGYLYATLYWEGIEETVRFHPVALETFAGPRPDGHDINHIDGDKSHNCPSNLEYLTRQEHTARTVAMGLHRHGVLHGMAKLTESDVRTIRASTESQSRLGARYGVSRTTIGRVQRRMLWRHID